MSHVLSLAWRCLLVFGLVLNPVVGAGIAHAADVVPATAKAPPCHQAMAMQQHATGHDAPAPCHDGDPGCGHGSCQFGACCLAGTLDLPSTVVLPARHGSESVRSRQLSLAPAPLPARMIRPPIA
jgi:hypothetical protein